MPEPPAAPSRHAFLAGGGQVGARIAAFDWGSTPLGPIEAWGTSLRSTVSLVLNSGFPTYLAWGPELLSFYNDAYHPFLGSRPEALGRSFPEVWPELWPHVGPIAQAAREGRASFHERLPLTVERDDHAEMTWWTFSYSPVRAEAGVVMGVLCTVYEVTAAVLAERRLEFMVALADALRTAAGPQEITLLAAELAGCHLGADRAGYGEIDPTGQIVSVARDWHTDGMTSLAGQARILDAFGPEVIALLRRGDTLVVDDCRSDLRTIDSRFQATWESIGTRALIVVPLVRDGRLDAIFYIHAAAPRRWTAAEVALVEDVTHRTGSAHAQARAEEALRSREQQLQSAMDAADLGTWELDLAAGRSIRSARHDQLFGFAEPQPTWSPAAAWTNMVPEDIAAAKAAWDRGLATGVFRYEARVRQPDGSLRWVAVQGRTPDDGSGRVVGVIQDITERRAMDQAVRENEERFRALAEAVQDVFYVTDLDTNRLVYLSPAYERVWGRPRNEIMADLDRYLDTVHPEDRPLLTEHKPAQTRGEPTELQYRIIRPDGEERWIHDRSFPVPGASGRHSAGLAADVTDRRAAEQRLRASEARVRRAHEAGRIGDWTWDIATGATTLSGQFPRLLALPPADLPTNAAAFFALVHPDDRERVCTELATFMRGQAGRFDTEFRIVRGDGELRWLAATAEAEGRLPDGRPARLLGVNYDVTHRYQAQAALRASEERLNLGLAAGRMMTWEYDIATGQVNRSANADALVGPGAELATFRSRMPVEDARADQSRFEAALAGTAPAYQSEFRYRHPGGQLLWLQMQGRVLRDASGTPLRVHGVCMDITARKQAELALHEMNATLEAQVEQRTRERDKVWHASRDLMCVADADGTLLGVNPAWERLLGRRPEELVGRRFADLASAEDDGRLLTDLAENAARSGLAFEVRLLHRDGHAHWISWTCEREGHRIYAVGRDVTADKLREEALAASERRFRAIFDSAFQFMALLNPDGIVLEVNQTAMNWSRIPPAEIVGRPFWQAAPMRGNPTLQAAIRQAIRRAASGEVVRDEFEMRGAGDVVATVDFSLKAVLGNEGEPVSLVAEGRDISELKRAQDQLRQAQKMEAVGQLTGGIAHDFNNLLHALQGSLDLIRRKPDDVERVRRWANNALQAAERGAKLTGQLLAFSRSQRLQLRPVVAADLIAALGDLLARTLGPMVRLELDLDQDRMPVLADPTQLEMAVLNLAINARDAMPNGGALRIATRPSRIERDAELSPGDYLEVSVGDSGAGMPTEVAARAFDPFFTTKGVGKGTGLGLSQVYGFAKQAGGTARLYSVPERGTVVTLFLRRADQQPDDAAAEPPAMDQPPAVQAAEILVVDDDQDVRQILAETLRDLGYRVREAEGGQAALALLEQAPPDLLVVDFAMPGMNGAELARAVRARYPRLPVVFASGYAETAAIDAAMDGPPLLLRKPFRMEDLEAVLATALERPSGPGGG